MANTILDLVSFFGEGSTRQIELDEFRLFWVSLSKEELAYYRSADLGNDDSPVGTICGMCHERVAPGMRFHHYKYCLGE